MSDEADAWCWDVGAREEGLLTVTRDARRQTGCQANETKVGVWYRKEYQMALMNDGLGAVGSRWVFTGYTRRNRRRVGKREEKKIERGNGSSRMDDASDRTLTHILKGAAHSTCALA
jgi:hypothetical protein